MARAQATRFEKAMRLGLNVNDLINMNNQDFASAFNYTSRKGFKPGSKKWNESVEGQRRNLVAAYKSPQLQKNCPVYL